MGVNLEALRDKNNVRVIDGSPLLNLGNIDVSEGGLNVGFLDSTLAVFIEALDTVGDTEVIAAPRLLCLNKQRAEILIGDQKGYLNTTQTETATTQTVEFLDVGTQLRIRPFISSDGMIRMEVHPELSTGDVRLLGTFALPEKSVTQVTTNIMCRDGATVVIGGLIRDDVTRTINQIPLLGNLRLLGPIFRHKNDSVQRNEIIVVITPHVIQDPLGLDDGRPHVSEMHRRQSKVFVDRMTPVARRYYSNRYVRLAESAWLAGNGDQALSYIDLALHFTPRRFEALNLRDEILTGGPGQIELIQSLEPLDYVDDPPLDAPAPPPSFSLPQPPVPADGAPASLPQAAATPSHRRPEDVVTPVPIQRTSLLQNIGPPPLGAPLP
jgi:type IV pilus assembly protein PilQ